MQALLVLLGHFGEEQLAQVELPLKRRAAEAVSFDHEKARLPQGVECAAYNVVVSLALAVRHVSNHISRLGEGKFGEVDDFCIQVLI
jgi:hypothetical protein